MICCKYFFEGGIGSFSPFSPLELTAPPPTFVLCAAFILLGLDGRESSQEGRCVMGFIAGGAERLV